MTNDLAQLDVFYGDLTANRAYVYARLPRPAEDAGLSLVGQVRGPRCLHAQTLPVTSPLVDLGPGPTLLAQAVLPDPCFWSPDLPAIYDVTVHLLRDKEIVASARREIGLRALGVRGRHLFLSGKRWVLRGVSTRSTTERLPREWHDASAGYYTDSCDPDLLAEASQWGALSVVEVGGSPEELAVQLRALAQHPAVAVAIVRGALPADFRLSQVSPNLLLAQAIGPSDDPDIKPWTQAILAEAADPHFVSRIATKTDLPLIAFRAPAKPFPIDQARAACDALQRDLASVGQFAGYVV